MTLDQLHARINALIDEQPHLRHLPVAIRAFRRRGRSYVLDLRYVSDASLSIDGLLHAELVADMRDLPRANDKSGAT